MDISTGRCPNKKMNCECKRVCAALYGEEVRRLKDEAMDESFNIEEREKKIKEWQFFIKLNARKI